jgi:hypothetical protein
MRLKPQTHPTIAVQKHDFHGWISARHCLPKTRKKNDDQANKTPNRPVHYRAFLRVCFTQRRPAAGPLSARTRYSLPLRRW